MDSIYKSNYHRRNVTIIARIRSKDKVLSASSFTITKIKKKEEAIDVDIPEEFVAGEDYELPKNCTINNTRYTNIKELEVGE